MYSHFKCMTVILRWTLILPDNFILFSSPYTLHSFFHLANVIEHLLCQVIISHFLLSPHISNLPFLVSLSDDNLQKRTFSPPYLTASTPIPPTHAFPTVYDLAVFISEPVPPLVHQILPSPSHPLKSIASFPLGSSIIHLLDYSSQHAKMLLSLPS